MGLGKTYSADYLIDSNGNTGVSGQVLISTATGIDWADGSAITGGPFLPLAGGTLTGNLTISNASPALNLTDTDNASNISFSSVGGALIVNSSSDQVYQIAGAEKMRINSSGNVGIGHSVLHQKFTVNGNIDIRGGDSSLLTFNNGDGGISVHYNNADSLDGRDIAFKTYKEGVGNTEKMRITRDGNVGIGTAGPSQKLTVVGNTYVSSGLLLLDNNQDIRWGDAGERITGHNTNGLVFTTNNFETMRINSQGKVGIGTTDPGSLLQVGGLDDGSNYDITLGWNAVDSEAVGTKRSAITFKTGQTSVNTGDIYKWDIAMLAAPATVTNEEFGSDLAFLRSTRGSTATDATTMILTRTGNVGIGTGVPAGSLDVYGTTGSKVRIALFTDQNTDDPTLKMFYGKQTRPGYSFISDNTTGLFSSASGGFLGFSVSQSERMRITSGGNVGIGTTSPDSKLEVDMNDTSGNRLGFIGDGSTTGSALWTNWTTGASYLDFRLGGITDAHTKMRITHTGNVGIGTTAPSEMLEIKPGSGGDSKINMLDSAGAQKALIGYDNGNGGLINLYNQAGTRNVVVRGYGNSYFNGGNFGIGTTAPDAPLHILKAAGGANIVAGLKLDPDDATANSGISIDFNASTTNTGASLVGSRIVGAREGGNASGFLALYTSPDASGSVPLERMRITSGGNVGIGCTPDQKLHVKGTIETQATNSTNGWQLYTYTDNTFRINYNGVGSDELIIDSSGNVGIGVVPKTGGSAWQHIQFGGTGNIIGRISDSTVDAMFANNYYINSSNTDTHIVTGAATRMFLNDGEIRFDTAPSAAADAVAAFTNRLFIANTGNVGIGTTDPAAKLDVVVSNVSVTPNTDSSAVFRKNGHNYISILSGDTNEGGVIFGNSADAADGYIAYKHGTGAADQAFVFGTANGERMRITKGGNVGIGATSPNAKLDVVGNTRLGSGTLHVSTDQTFGTGFTYSFRDAVGILNPNGTSAASATAVMSIGGMSNGYSLVTTGNVGVGTTSPTHKLHVNGDMRLTGALRDSNNAKGSAGQVLSSTGSATDWIPLPATPTIYTPKVYNLNNSTNINSQGQKLVPDFGTLEIEGNTTVQQVSGSDTDFQVTDENTGIYEVTYAVFYKNTGNQRTPLGTYLTLNGTAVNGSLMVNYVRSNVAGGGNFSSCTNTFYVNVTDASHPMALCVRRADSSTAPSGISMVEPAGMAVKSTISFRRIS